MKDPITEIGGNMVAMGLQERVTMCGLEKFVAAMNQPTRLKLKKILDEAILKEVGDVRKKAGD